MVRVRFAPSPTGFLHIGGLRTALYNFLFARKNNGVFILRIEDTDQARSVAGGVENIIKALEWAGLNYDEGPYIENPKFPASTRVFGEAGEIPSLDSCLRRGGRNPKSNIIEKGEYGPYIQSKRLDIYKKYAEELVKNDHAYYCFCDEARLDGLRQAQIAAKKPPMYDGLCKSLSREEIASKLKKGEMHVIRLNVPDTGETIVNDLIHGEIKFKNLLIDDQVLLKSDDFPTYHLANVVDDHLMRVTHVIRGDEWLPSTPKHVLLYQAFDWVLPEFAHLPLLLNSDRSKLSKRQGDVAVEDYIKKGYLREALINFVALLGWNASSEQEIYSLDQLIQSFDLVAVNKSGAIFNLEKLNWLNGYYIRGKTLSELTNLFTPYLERANLIAKYKSGFKIIELAKTISRKELEAIIKLEQERIEKLEDIVYGTEFFFKKELDYLPELLVWKKNTQASTKNNLKNLHAFFKKFKKQEFILLNLANQTKEWIHENKLDNGSVLWPMRVALSGRQASPPPFDIAEILGKDETLKRIEKAIDKL